MPSLKSRDCSKRPMDCNAMQLQPHGYSLAHFPYQLALQQHYHHHAAISDKRSAALLLYCNCSEGISSIALLAVHVRLVRLSLSYRTLPFAIDN